MKKKQGKLAGFSQGILWSRNRDKLDWEKDENYIIHQVLMYGQLEDIKQLMRIYSHAKVKEIFLKRPAPIYTPQAFNFISKFILRLDGKNLDRNKYVKNIY